MLHSGHQPERMILTRLGPVAIEMPKVRDRLGERHGLSIHSRAAVRAAGREA
jgi:hypothetical protein